MPGSSQGCHCRRLPLVGWHASASPAGLLLPLSSTPADQPARGSTRSSTERASLILGAWSTTLHSHRAHLLLLTWASARTAAWIEPLLLQHHTAHTEGPCLQQHLHQHQADGLADDGAQLEADADDVEVDLACERMSERPGLVCTRERRERSDEGDRC